MAAHRGAMTAAQKAYVIQQIQAGKAAANPFASAPPVPPPISTAPPFDQKWLGTADLWSNPAAAWQRVMAAHGGAMTAAQKAYVIQQIQAGKAAANPFTSAPPVPPPAPQL